PLCRAEGPGGRLLDVQGEIARRSDRVGQALPQSHGGRERDRDPPGVRGGGLRRRAHARAQRSRGADARRDRQEEVGAMSSVRGRVGTGRGAFILRGDGKRRQWDVSGPHFGGGEIYHLRGSPADPNRLYASQSSSWFGQVIQRSSDGGKTWEAVGN